MNSQTALEQVSSILGRTIVCTLDDGRTVEGKLECLDRLSNIILRDALEKRFVKDPSIYGIRHTSRKHQCHDDQVSKEEENEMILERKLSQVLVPGKHLVKVELL
jgi:small nuclear ribonucleoprotein (snRNP)-like protein